MTKKDIFQKIEKQRNSKVVAYLTSDRQEPINARIIYYKKVKNGIEVDYSEIFD